MATRTSTPYEDWLERYEAWAQSERDFGRGTVDGPTMQEYADAHNDPMPPPDAQYKTDAQGNRSYEQKGSLIKGAEGFFSGLDNILKGTAKFVAEPFINIGQEIIGDPVETPWEKGATGFQVDGQPAYPKESDYHSPDVVPGSVRRANEAVTKRSPGDRVETNIGRTGGTNEGFRARGQQYRDLITMLIDNVKADLKANRARRAKLDEFDPSASPPSWLGFRPPSHENVVLPKPPQLLGGGYSGISGTPPGAAAGEEIRRVPRYVRFGF